MWTACTFSPVGGYATEVGDARPVRRQTYGYLPSRSASPPLDRYQVWLVTGRRAFSVAGPAACNSLPDYLRDPSRSFDSFRRDLKTFLSRFAAYTAHQRLCDYALYKSATPWGRKKEPIFFCVHLFSTWQKLVNFFTYIRNKESRPISYNSVY